MALYNYLNTAQTKLLTEALVPWFQGCEQQCIVQALDRAIKIVFDDVDVDLNSIYTRLNTLETTTVNTTGTQVVGGNKTFTGFTTFKQGALIDATTLGAAVAHTFDVDSGFSAYDLYRIGGSNRIQIGMSTTGSLFVNTWNDTGVSQGQAWATDNDTRITNFNVSPTMPTAATGTNTTQGATTAFVNSSIDVHEAALAADTGASLIGYKSTGTGATSRTAEARLRDTISVKDFGALGDGVTDDRTAIINAAAAATAANKALYFPAGNFVWTSTITLTSIPSIIGAGEGNTTFTCAFNGPAFTFNNEADAGYKRFKGFIYIGPGSAATNTASCCIAFVGTGGATFCKFDFMAQSCYAGVRSDSLAVLGGAGWRGTITWCEFAIETRAGVKYGTLLNQGSGTGNSWIGRRTAIGIPGGAVVEVNGDQAAANSNAGVNAGDMLFVGIHCISETGEASGSHTSALLRIGPNTTYRSRIAFAGCQVDAQMDKPLDFSSVGSVGYSDIRWDSSNSVGGNANFYDYVPAITRSVVVDQSVGRWESEYTGTSPADTTPVSKAVFKMELIAGTGCSVEMVVDGNPNGACVRRYLWTLRAGTGTVTIVEHSNYLNGTSTASDFVLTPTVSGNIVTWTLTYTPSGTSTVNYNVNMVAIGGRLRIQNARRTF